MTRELEGTRAFITGGGNLYSQTGALYIMIMGGTLNNAATPTQVVMNVATAGSTLNLASVRLSLFDNSGSSMSISPALSELRADSPTPPQGAAQTWAFTWNTAGVPLTATGFRVEFSAGAPSMSLDCCMPRTLSPISNRWPAPIMRCEGIGSPSSSPS